jgi:hypothetical protein
LSIIEPNKYNPKLTGRVVRRTWGCSVIERRSAIVVKVDAALNPYSAPTGCTVADLLVAS